MNSPKSSLPQIVLDYVDLIIRKMKYKRKVRQDVRAELLTHFEDALWGVENEQDRQKQAEELIRDFGDVKLLATLIRRGKKRCRPVWQTMVVRMFQAVGVLSLLMALYLGWFFSGKPIITTNYLEVMNKQVRPVADDNQNAWPYYKQAAEKYSIPDDTEFDRYPRSLSTLTQEQHNILLKWISNNQESLDLIHQGNQKPHFWQIYDTKDNDNKELIMVFVPYLNEYKNIAYLLCWQALLNAKRGDMQNAFGITLESYSFGYHLRGHNSTLIEQIVAIAIEVQVTKTYRILLDENIEAIDVPLLDSIRKQFETINENKTFAVNFNGEKVYLYDEIQRSFTMSRIGKSHLYLNRIRRLDDILNAPVLLMSANQKGNTSSHAPSKESVSKVKRVFHILFTHPDQEQTRKAAEQLYSEINAVALKTPATLHREHFDSEREIRDIIKNNVFLEMALPPFSNVMALSHRYQTDSEATLTILAIIQYQKQQGQYPDSLEMVMQSGLLNKLPMDPYSDKPLVYRKTKEGFTLYSVGYNFVDDGGVRGKDGSGNPTDWGQDGDFVFWPVYKEPPTQK